MRVIRGPPRPEALHHALDEVLLERVAAGESEPTLRFWRREEPAVALGRFQSYADEVRDEYVRARDVDVVRRVTGGGAIYVEPGSVVTYSLYLDGTPGDVEDSYARLDAPTVAALRELGLDARHEPLNDVALPAGKVGGSAQLRSGGATLHHATLSHDLDVREMLRVLRVGEEKLSDKAVESAARRVAPVADHCEATRAEVADAVERAHVAERGGERGDLARSELSAAERRVERRFATDEWTRRL